MASSSSSSSSYYPPSLPMAMASQEKYDVFLSFRGEDTRQNFTSHLYAALDRKKIYTYMDHKLDRGDEVSPALVKAIQESKLSVIIFSKSYANSSWCLNELLRILECRRNSGQLVIPVFYDVDPSHVRKQEGNFGQAFSQLEVRFKETDMEDLVKQWRAALEEAANLCGWDSTVTRPDSRLVQAIVEDILWKLNYISPCDHFEGLVGIDKRYEQIKSLLCIGSPDVRIVGLLGMGGIGKTTIAGVLFQLLSCQFESCYFLKGVREKSEKGELDYWRKELLSALLEDNNLKMSNSYIESTFVRRRLQRKRVLVVFDDVDKPSQFKSLIKVHDLFGPGSRIIVTTRDEHVINIINAHVHRVEKLSNDEALQLLHLNAFSTRSPATYYSELSQRVLDYAKGSPLALEVVGSFLSDKSIQEWESALRKLKMTSNQDIHNVLRISYDRLDPKEKDLFLDIACFFKGEDVDNVQKVLDSCGFFVGIGIKILKLKSLVTIENNLLQMHDLIQEMGWEIVRQECLKEPGSRSRLWIAEDVYHVLKNNTGTKAVEGLYLDVNNIGEVELCSSIFSNMYNLRLLKIYNHRAGNCIQKCKVCLPQGLECFPYALRYLYWEGYDLKSLPSKFSPEKLVELSMIYSQLEQLWDGVQNLCNLRKIDLSYSVHLTQIPNLCLASNLDSINLEKCTSLLELPSCFQYLNNVTYLNLRYCSNLKILSEVPRNIEYLDLCGTGVEELPPSFSDLCKLRVLDLGKLAGLENFLGSTFKPMALNQLTFFNMFYPEIKPLDLSSTYIRALPSSIKHLSSLIQLDLHQGFPGWLNFSPVPKIDSIEDLQSPYLEETEITELVPNNIYRLEWFLPSCCLELSKLPILDSLCSLCTLNLSFCTRLVIPDCIGCLSSLQSLNLSGSSIKSIPASIKQLCKLNSLDISNCKSLKSLPDELPWFLQRLEASGCTSLEKVPSLSAALKRGWDRTKAHEMKPSEDFIFFNCPKLNENAKNNIMDDAQLRILRIATLAKIRPVNAESYPSGSARVSICCPGREIPSQFNNQTVGSSTFIYCPPDLFNANLLGFAVCAVVEFNECFSDDENFLSRYSPCESQFETDANGESHKLNHTLLDWEGCSIVPKGKIRVEKSNYLFLWYHYCETCSYDGTTNVKFDMKPLMIEHDCIDLCNVKKYGIRPLYAQDAKDVFNEDVGGLESPRASNCKTYSYNWLPNVKLDMKSLMIEHDCTDLCSVKKYAINKDVFKDDVWPLEIPRACKKAKRRRNRFEASTSGTVISNDEDWFEMPRIETFLKKD